jgi:aspartyl-tRNA(Asn)/glutamyl-tRNA(Gln) amidotransferase subunit A
LTTPFNVTGGPALVQCIGLTNDGLPLSMQLVGRPFDDALVMRAAYAYEQATPWRKRRPALAPSSTFSTDLPALPAPEKATVSERERDDVASACRRAGLNLNERAFEQLCATAPYIEAMVGRLRRDRAFTEEPTNVFQFSNRD